jgi:2-deoxy-D-gluconate 3-dehydrogenase
MITGEYMTDYFSLSGRVALVTGGSRGIGRMIAEGFIRQGAKVYITARKAAMCEAAAEEMSADGGTCIALPYDISTMDGIAALAAEVAGREDNRLSILVNNAGAAWAAKFEEMPESGWDKVVDLNMKTPFS